MGNITNPHSYSARERLLFLERLAYWRGWVRRSDLVDRFGVSVPQASADIAAYNEANPRALRYDSSAKRYEGVASMRCVIGAPDLGDGLALLHGFTDTVTIAHIDLPNRSAPSPIQRDVLRAASARAPIQVYYYSVHSDRESWRTIVPRSFAHDGYRWHIRAWCTEDDSYKDFVLGRIARAKPAATSVIPPADEEWETFVTLRLRPHRSLGAAQKKAIEHDFGMKDGLCVLKVRKAMLGYTLAYLGLSAEERPKLLELVSE
jgi:predicted DNA-binding transcriptional regulator YafY